jgi:PEP-CTERM motif
MKKALVLSTFLAAGLAFTPSVRATPINVSYMTGNLGQGTGADTILKTVTGENVMASAWSTTGGNVVFSTATLGQYSGLGLGVCDASEMPNCGAPQHEVDDNGQYNFVLFTFSTPVTGLSITITPVCNCDTNASYYVGNNLSPSTLSLTSLGAATDSIESAKDQTRTVVLTGLGNGVNSVLFGASTSANNNYFKIESLSITEGTNAPEPTTLGLVGGTLMGFLIWRRNSAKRTSAK